MFEYISGDMATDLVNTASWTKRGLEDDELTSYDQLLKWAEGAGALSTAMPGSFRGVDAAAALAAARRLRQILHDVFTAVVEGRAPDLTALNAELARVMPRRQLEGTHWVWRDAEHHLDSPLWPVILAAATLLTSPDAARLRICAKPDCGWMFVDRSRNGLRRWCSMAECGTEEKSRRRAARAKQTSSVARRAP